LSRPPKIDRKSLRNPDEFVKRGRVFLSFFYAERLPFIGIGIVAALIIAGVYGVDWWNGRQSDLGWKAYDDAMKASEPARWEELKKVYGKYAKSRPGFFAALSVGDHFFDEAKKEAVKDAGNPSAAATQSREWYTKALGYSELVGTEKQLLYLNRGTTYEMEKNFDQSLADYQKASEFSGQAKGLALLSVARAYELKNDLTKATATYQKVTKDFSNSEYSRQAKNDLRRLKSPLFNDKKSG
jgi:tetratricopeptide (TPR) repeat protein